MFADVAQRRRADQCIANGMQQHVGVGVTNQTPFIRNGDAADDERAALGQRVDIEALAYTHGTALQLRQGNRKTTNNWGG